MAIGFAPILFCVVWNAAIKAVLIVVVSVMLAGVVALLAMEIIGKRNDVSPLPQAEGDSREQPAEENAEEQPPEEETTTVDDEEPSDDREMELTDEAVLVDDEEQFEMGTVIVGETRVKVRYNRSFTAKLIQADDTLKSAYSDLRNELVRYGLKSRMSWSNESWYLGRNTYAKFAIRGKTLSLYLALDPDEFEGTKYIFRDARGVEKYREVPMRVKLTSDRAVRWSKELIFAAAAKKDLKRQDLPEENFRPDYRNTTSLVREKLVKLHYVTTPNASRQAMREAAAADLKAIDRTPRDFTTRLMHADSELKARYSAVKNELLRYGMKSRMSTGNESWYRGRVTYAKFAIRGKTLFLYLALNPAEFEGTKYHFRNVAEVGKYGTVPMCVKLKSDRAVTRVKELIATLAEKKGWPREEMEERDFRYVKKKKK